MTVTARSSSDPEAVLRPRRRSVLALLVSAQLVVMLDVSIVNVALPSIQADLGTGAMALTWVVNAYALAFGGLLLLAGRLTDLVGRRRMFVAGSAVFTAGTALAATADHTWVLVLARAVQGLGASALSPAAMSLLLLSFPGPARARAMGAWSAASAVGGAAGVVIGGLIAGSFGWRANFLVTVPVTLVAAAAARRLLPADETGPRTRVDGLGAVLLATTTISLVHGVLGAADGGWATAPVMLSLAVATVAGTGFVITERRTSEPLTPVGIFRSRTLTTGMTAALLGGAARASTFVLIALYLQQALALAPGHAGLAMVPTSATVFVVSLLALPRLLRAHGPERTMVAGLLVLAAGHLWLAQAPGGASYAVGVLPGLLLVATGVALSFTPTTLVVTAALPQQHTGLASGLAGSATQVGSAAGTAVFVSVGLAVGGGLGTLTPSGFSAAFTAAAAVSVATALLGATLVPATPRHRSSGRRTVVLAAVAALVLTPAAVRVASADARSGALAAGSSSRQPFDAAALDRFMSDQLEATSIPGAAVAVTHGDEVVHLAGFGRDSTGARVTGETLFRVASLSKSFTALAVMQLVEGGRVQLDDTVVEHLHEFRVDDPRGADITVRQLLEHTSGLADSTVHPLDDPQPGSLREAVAGLGDAPLAAAPGTRWSYHNPNYQVAARLVEVVSGESFSGYLRGHVFGPAGMDATTAVDGDNDPVPGLAQGHVVGWGHAFSVRGPGTFTAGDGGIVSSVTDMARWLVVQTNRGRSPDGAHIIGPRSLAIQHAAAPTGPGYALGWGTHGPSGSPTRLEHTGNVLTYSAYMAVLPQSGYGVVLLLNAGSGLMLDQTGIFWGVRNLIEGTDPTPTGPAQSLLRTANLDRVLGGLTGLVIMLGVLGTLRAPRWALKRRRHRTRAVVQALPHLVLFLAALAYLQIAERLVLGRQVTWEEAAYGWPALTALICAVLAALGTTWASRTWSLTFSRNARQ